MLLINKKLNKYALIKRLLKSIIWLLYYQQLVKKILNFVGMLILYLIKISLTLQYSLKSVKFFAQVRWLYSGQQLQSKILHNIAQFNPQQCMVLQNMLDKC